MRLLLLLIAIGVAAYYTVPARAAHEAEARAVMEAYQPIESAGVTLDSVISYVRGMMAGQGRYENMQLFSKYTLDMPGAAFVECYGAFTIVRCSVIEPNAG